MNEPAADALRAALEAAVGGQYKVLRLLGRGAMGAVYLAREAALERLVAVKVLPPEAGGAADRRERFRREARTAARLTHPHIVPLHAFGENEAVLYFVMGYVQGETLTARLRREGQISADEVRRILADVALALDYAHRQGVIHRDVKPDNILIDDESGRAMLTDFGVARSAGMGGTLTEAGSILGTPHYMSPEQASGGSLDGRTDIYALGVTGYALLCGHLPFEGTDARDVLLQVLGRQPAPVASLVRDAPADLARAIDRCLVKDPAARWPDARTLAEALAPGAGVEASLPEALAEVEERGFWLVLWGLGAAYLGGFAYLFRRDVGPILLTILATIGAIPTLVLVGFLGRVWAARRGGSGWGEILRVALRHPDNWAFWYPRGLRRPGDAWDRLPRPVRRLRLMATAAIGFAFAPVLSYAGLALPEAPLAEAFFWVSLSAFFVFLPALAVELVRSHAWARKQGLAGEDRLRLLSLEPTSRPGFWKRPEIARLLLAPPAASGTASGEPRSPTECVAAIEAAVRRLEAPAPEAASEALVVARVLVGALRALDEEKARLATDADAGEAQRVRQKLEALGPEAAGEAEERRQMRALLSQQLQLLQRVEDRLGEAGARQGRLLARLRELWRGVTMLGQGSEAAARLRTLCAEIQAEAREGPIDETPTLAR